MSLDALIMSAGAFVAVLPFLGFPNRWDNIFFLVAGIFTIALGIIVRRRLGRIARTMQNEHMSIAGTSRHEDELAQ